jgi:hypothetical protein
MVDVPPDRQVLVQLVAADLHATAPGAAACDRSGSSCPAAAPCPLDGRRPHLDRRVLVQLVAADLHATTPGQELEAVVVRRDQGRRTLGGAPPRSEELGGDGSRVAVSRRDRDAIAARGLPAERVAGTLRASMSAAPPLRRSRGCRSAVRLTSGLAERRRSGQHGVQPPDTAEQLVLVPVPIRQAKVADASPCSCSGAMPRSTKQHSRTTRRSRRKAFQYPVVDPAL